MVELRFDYESCTLSHAVVPVLIVDTRCVMCFVWLGLQHMTYLLTTTLLSFTTDVTRAVTCSHKKSHKKGGNNDKWKRLFNEKLAIYF